MEEWDPASNDFVLRCNSCWRTSTKTKIIRTSREKYYCLDCLATFDLCQGQLNAVKHCGGNIVRVIFYLKFEIACKSFDLGMQDQLSYVL